MRCVTVVKVPREVTSPFLIMTKSTYLAQIRILAEIEKEINFKEGIKFDIVSADVLLSNVVAKTFELIADEAKASITNLYSPSKKVVFQNGIYTENLGRKTKKVS